MIAMALSCEPELIIADEITTALDVTIQAQVLDLLRRAVDETGTSLLVITHDLGIVAGMTDRVHVMYAGQIVERATTSDLFAEPRMPYTWGLLRSLPRLDNDGSLPLVPIDGVPPDLLDQPSGCRFEPRCPFRQAICRDSAPGLAQAVGAADGHEVRCWGSHNIAGGGWLRGIDGRSGQPAVPAIGPVDRSAASDGSAGAIA
jgi:oligopeptide transport system ATP-binding protein